MAESHDPTPPALYDETMFDNPQISAGERLELHAERSRVTKLAVEGRRAIVTRRVVVERKTLEIDVLHEELHVDYLPGSGREMAGAEPESIIVRLHAEDVEIVKHVRVVEEVVLSKRRIVETLPVRIDLKHEELKVQSNLSEL
jgi:uncharacterized protein (TIGR02271 family)